MKTLDIAKLRLKNHQLINSQYSEPHDVVRWMGAIQAQDFSMSQWAIGIRMKKPSLTKIENAYQRAEILRLHLHRGTWQIVAKEDIRWMLNLFGQKAIKGWSGFSTSIGAPITDKLMDDSRDLLQKALKGGGWLTREDILPLFESLDIKDLNHARHLLNVAEAEGTICSGPIDGRGVTYALLDERAPVAECKVLSYEESLKETAKRYFQSHSPATMDDYAWWCGLTKKECRIGIEQLGDYVTTIQQDGQTYYLPSNMEPVRMPKNLVHLLPPYDELLIGYKNREAVLPKIYEHKAHNNYGVFHPIILFNRDIVGNWVRRDLKCEFFSYEPSSESLEKAKNVYMSF